MLRLCLCCSHKLGLTCECKKNEHGQKEIPACKKSSCVMIVECHLEAYITPPGLQYAEFEAPGIFLAQIPYICLMQIKSKHCISGTLPT